MQYCIELDLPASPLKNDALVEELCQIKQADKTFSGQGTWSYQNYHSDIDRYLHPDLIETLLKIKAEPLFFIHFGGIDTPAATTVLHTDLFKINNCWITQSFGINWELTPGTTTWNWYTTNDLETIMPADHLQGFNSQHYGQRFNRDVSACTKLESVSLKRHTPYLMRADIPHQITYTSDVKTRVCLSLRFCPTKIATWMQAIRIFAPLFRH